MLLVPPSPKGVFRNTPIMEEDFFKMLINVLNFEVCDATEDPMSSFAGYKNKSSALKNAR